MGRIAEIMALATGEKAEDQAAIPKELAKWVKMVKMMKLDADKLERRMKNPMTGNRKLIPRIAEIMALATGEKAEDQAAIPKELAKWVKMVKMTKICAGELEGRMKKPMGGAPKLIPRIAEIMALAVPIPEELAKWVKMVKRAKLDDATLETRMKRPMGGAPKLIPRIPEIMELVARLS